MADNEYTELATVSVNASASAGEDVHSSKQAACHECRRSKVKCVRPPDATTCNKCANAGVECIVPRYHVGRYKGVKNKRSGLDKAIHQVEEAVKKARTKGAAIQDDHARALRKLLDESEDPSQKDIENNRGTSREKTVSHESLALTTNPVPTPLQEIPETHSMSSEPLVRNIEEDGDMTVNNANNPLQLLAIASAIPEAVTGNPSPDLNRGISPTTTTTTVSGDADEMREFFSPLSSKLDIGKDLDPQDLGLVSDQEVIILFTYFHDYLAHTRWGLDRVVHSPSFVRSRSAYLFTSILSGAALFLPDTAALYIRLSNHCRFLAHRIVSGGFRSVEIVLAYMINVPWMQPGKNWAADDETCYYISTAMTIAIDLSLNKIVLPSSTMRLQGAMERVTPSDCIDSQRALNMDCHMDTDPACVFGRRLLRIRERAWLALFTLERGVCLARGRTWTLPIGPLIDTCDAWHVSDIADPWDGSLIATAVLRRDFGNLVANVRATCDNHQSTANGGASIVKVIREKIEGFFAQWDRTWTYQIQQSDGTLPAYVEILVSHGRLSAYCNVINHPTASKDVKQFFRAAGLTAALHVIRVAVQNESKLHSMPNNSVIMVSFAACFVLGLSTSRQRGQIYIADHVRESIDGAADVLERIGSVTAHRKGASMLFGRHIKRIMRHHTTTVETKAGFRKEDLADTGTMPAGSISGSSTAPYTLHLLSDDTRTSFPGFGTMTDDQLLEAIQNSKDDIDTFNAGLQSEDSLFMDWLDWPSMT